MKKHLHIYLAVLLVVSTIVFSCRKELNFFDDHDKVSNSDIEPAKIFYSKAATLNSTLYKSLLMSGSQQNNGSSKVKKRPFIKLSPQWKNAYMLRNSENNELIVVPTIEAKLTSGDFELRRFFIFEKIDGQISEGHIVELLGYKYSLKGKLDNLIANYHSGVVEDLDGAIFEYDLNYIKQKGEVINHGKRTGTKANLYNLPSSVTSVNSMDEGGYWSTGIVDANGCQKLWFCQGDTYQAGITCYYAGYASSCNPTPPPTGSDSGYDSSGSNSGGGPYGGNDAPPFQYVESLVYKGVGPKPKEEYTDKCAGFQSIWNNHPDKEVFGFITKDLKLIVTDIVSFTGGAVSGLYSFQGQLYYVFPDTNGAPTGTYDGMIYQASQHRYFIPVVASVHTHSPCRSDGTNGVSHPVGDEDKALAATYPTLRNFVIGCNAIAQYNSGNSFFNVQTGTLSSNCGTIK